MCTYMHVCTYLCIRIYEFPFPIYPCIFIYLCISDIYLHHIHSLTHSHTHSLPHSLINLSLSPSLSHPRYRHSDRDRRDCKNRHVPRCGHGRHGCLVPQGLAGTTSQKRPC